VGTLTVSTQTMHASHMLGNFDKYGGLNMPFFGGIEKTHVLSLF